MRFRAFNSKYPLSPLLEVHHGLGLVTKLVRVVEIAMPLERPSKMRDTSGLLSCVRRILMVMASPMVRSWVTLAAPGKLVSLSARQHHTQDSHPQCQLLRAEDALSDQASCAGGVACCWVSVAMPHSVEPAG